MQHHYFSDIVAITLTYRYTRTRMYQLTQKLKALKINLRSLNSHMASYVCHLHTSRQQLAVVKYKLATDVLNRTYIDG